MRKEKRKAEDHIPSMDNVTIGDFWAWAYSDILSNVVRGVYGEFIVASAINAVEHIIRNPWWHYDLSYQGLKLEVKTSAYVQTWNQRQSSKISFGINPKKSGERSADVYIFCLFIEQDELLAHDRVVDPNYWEFYIVPERILPNQKTLNLNSLKRLCKKHGIVEPIQYDDIQSTLNLLLIN